MKVWLLKDGENLPVQKDVSRMRMWLLADALCRSGHEVTWWSSTHSHQRKTLLFDADHTEVVDHGFVLSLLYAGRYDTNRSLRRYLHHVRLGRRFKAAAENAERPDVIVAAFPFLQLMEQAVAFGTKHRIPVIVDVRDPWPDAMINLIPTWAQRLLRPVTAWMHRSTGRCLQASASVVACSQGFMDWALALAHRPQRAGDKVFFLGRPPHRESTVAEPVECERTLTELGVEPDAIVFTFVGSFGHVYDLETVCRAASMLWQSGRRDICVILAGDGVKFDAIQRLSDGQPNVILTGWLDLSVAQRLLRATDVGLAPCRQLPGCVPNKISEYSSFGLPMISSLEGDMVDLLNKYEAGFSYRPGDPQTLYQHMLQLADDRSLRERQRKGSERMFVEKFDADRIYPEFVSHIEELVGSHSQ